MEEARIAIERLRGNGWTYASLGDAIGVRWDTVRSWHLGTHDPSAFQAVLAMLRTLEDQQAPPKRRYGPDAPQRRPRNA